MTITNAMLKCPCCGKLPKQGFNEDLLDIINELFKKFKGIEIISAYRCKNYNAMMNYDDDSLHIQGNAVDLYVPDATKIDAIAEEARILGCTGKIKKHQYENYIHIDNGPFEADIVC